MRDLGFTSSRSLYALQDETQTEWREIDRRRGYDSTSRHILDARVWYHKYQGKIEEYVEDGKQNDEDALLQGASLATNPERHAESRSGVSSNGGNNHSKLEVAEAVSR